MAGAPGRDPVFGLRKCLKIRRSRAIAAGFVRARQAITMSIRKAAVALSVLGLSFAFAESSAPAAGGPPRLVPRCYAQDLTVSSYGDFEKQATKWIGTCVAANREHQLVEGNASLHAVYDNVKHLAGTGKSAHVTTDFGFKDLGGGNWGVNSVTFATTVKAPAATPAPAPTPAPTPSNGYKPMLMPDEKLPASLEPELRVALVRVRAAIDEDGGKILTKAQGDRLRCQLTKLADPKTDDRQVSWAGACGVIFNTQSASQCNDLVDAKVKAVVHGKADLDRQELWFVHHLRPELVNISRRLLAGSWNTTSAMQFLRDLDLDYLRTVHGLERMRERTQGFHGVDEYVAINDWIADAQRDSHDINSCR